MSKIFVTHHTVLVRQQDTIAKDTHRREGVHMNSAGFITRLDFVTTACTSSTSFLVYASLLASSLFTSMYQHAQLIQCQSFFLSRSRLQAKKQGKDQALNFLSLCLIHGTNAFMTSQTRGIFMYLEHLNTGNVPRRKQIVFLVISCSM